MDHQDRLYNKCKFLISRIDINKKIKQFKNLSASNRVILHFFKLASINLPSVNKNLKSSMLGYYNLIPFVTLICFFVNYFMFDFKKNEPKYSGIHTEITYNNSTLKNIFLLIRNHILHNSYNHFKNNMIVLLCFGPIVEIYFGHFNYLIILIFLMIFISVLKVYLEKFYQYKRTIRLYSGRLIELDPKYARGTSTGFSGVANGIFALAFYIISKLIFVVIILIIYKNKYKLTYWNNLVFRIIIFCFIILIFIKEWDLTQIKKENNKIGTIAHMLGTIIGLMLGFSMDI